MTNYGAQWKYSEAMLK